MKIVILDGHTVNPNDLSWAPFETLGEVTIYERSTPDQVLERAKMADILLINKIKLSHNEFVQLPQLKYIGICATGTDNVDLKAAKQFNITVSNIPAYSTPSAAQHTFALLLEITNRVGLHNKSVAELEWVRSKDFSYFKKPLIELQDKILGIVGYGAIGQAVEKIASAFGMKILIHSKHAQHAKFGQLVAIDTLFEQSDFISLHTALTADTNAMVNSQLLEKMKPSAYLINTSRGSVINEFDLADYLNHDKIAGAALDVLSKEPPNADNPLLSAKNCIITPHVSWISKEARERLMNIAFNNLKSYLEGRPENVVG